MELTTEGSRAGYMNSVAEKSPEELLRMNRRGVKLKFPGSWKEKRTKVKTKYAPKKISEGLENSYKIRNNQRISIKNR